MKLTERAYTKFMIESGGTPLPLDEIPKVAWSAWGSVVQMILERAACEVESRKVRVSKKNHVDLREVLATAIRGLAEVDEKTPLKAASPNHLPRLYD